MRVCNVKIDARSYLIGVNDRAAHLHSVVLVRLLSIVVANGLETLNFTSYLSIHPSIYLSQCVSLRTSRPSLEQKHSTHLIIDFLKRLLHRLTN